MRRLSKLTPLLSTNSTSLLSISNQRILPSSWNCDRFISANHDLYM
ncbi:MAG: hypothetical protein V7K97_28595 [Nostoc sp.]